MDFCQYKLCFVCDMKIKTKGICLSMEKTYFTKTAFPSKISQLIGDSFMVVVSGEDKLCEGCAALINRSDKLEIDLLEIKRKITGFLNYKYNLNTEEEHLYTPDESENTKMEDDCKNFTFMDISPNKRLHSSSVQEDNQHTPSIEQEPQKTNEFKKCDLSSDVGIKSEPSHNKYQDKCGGVEYSKKPDKKTSEQEFIYEVVLKKLLEDNSVSDQKLTVLNPFFSKTISDRIMSQLTQGNTVVSEVKRESISSEYNLDNHTVVSTKTSDEENIFNLDQSNQSCITAFSTIPEAPDLSLFYEKSPKISLSNVEKDILFVGYPPETNLLNSEFKITVQKPEAKCARNHLKKFQKTAPQNDTIVSNVKKETLSSEYNFDNSTVLPIGTSDESIFNFDQSNLGNQTRIAAISTLPEVTDLPLLDKESSENSLSNVEKEILFVGYPPQTNVLNKEIKITVKKPKAKSARNCLKKDKKINTHTKLRPILPKTTYFSSILAPLKVIESSFHKKDTVLKRKPTTFVETFSTESIHNEHIKNNNSEVVRPTLNHSQDCSVEINTDRKIANDQEKVEKDSSQYENKNNCDTVYDKYFKDSEKEKKNHKKELSKHQKLYKCSFCEKHLKTKSGLHNHKAVHTGKFSFYCDFCGQGFVTRNGLVEHRSSHTKEERFICDVCGKKFNFQSTYWIHRKWHDNPFPYKCNDCGRLFKHSSLLSVHKRKHTGERPYKCSYCSLTFTVSNSLKRHLILHTKEYPFRCDACKQGFTTRFKWTEHLAKMHNIFIDKPPTDKKDYKVAVYDDEEESKNEKQTVNIESGGLENNEHNTKDTDISIPSFSDYLCERIVEIVLDNSTVLSEHSLTLSDSWLT